MSKLNRGGVVKVLKVEGEASFSFGGEQSFALGQNNLISLAMIDSRNQLPKPAAHDPTIKQIFAHSFQ